MTWRVTTEIDCGVSRGVSTRRVAVAMVPGVYEPVPSVTVPSWLALTWVVCNSTFPSWDNGLATTR